MGQIGAEQIGELIIVRQTPKSGRNPAAEFTSLCLMYTCKNIISWFTNKIWNIFQTTQHFLFSGFVLIRSLFLCLCGCVYMNDLACICAGSIHKRLSVQSDKVPISQSCDSDFLSVCQTATEGLSIQARAHILSHLLKHKLTWPVQNHENHFLLFCSPYTVFQASPVGKRTLDFDNSYFLQTSSVDAIWKFEEPWSEGKLFFIYFLHQSSSVWQIIPPQNAVYMCFCQN